MSKFTISDLFLWQSNGMQPDLLEDENPEVNDISEDTHLLNGNYKVGLFIQCLIEVSVLQMYPCLQM